MVAQNDDVVQDVIAAIQAAGLRPAEDILVTGADGTSLGAKSIREGRQLAISANSPAYAGDPDRANLRRDPWLGAARLGTAAELALADGDGGECRGLYRPLCRDEGAEPFDYRRISKVLHPEDRDPQAEVFPLDIDKAWEGIDRPEGWEHPEAYTKARDGGEWEVVRQEYADRYRIKFDGPSPNRKA